MRFKEDAFDFKSFVKAIIKCLEKFGCESSESLFIYGEDKEKEIHYFHDGYDIFPDEREKSIVGISLKKFTDVVFDAIKSSKMTVAFPFTNAFCELEAEGKLTCADGKAYKIEMAQDENGFVGIKGTNSPGYYGELVYSYSVRWEKGELVFNSCLQHYDNESIEPWPTWEKLDKPMETFLMRFKTI